MSEMSGVTAAGGGGAGVTAARAGLSREGDHALRGHSTGATGGGGGGPPLHGKDAAAERDAGAGGRAHPRQQDRRGKSGMSLHSVQLGDLNDRTKSRVNSEVSK